MKDQRKCMVHFEDKGVFPKVHWRILEDSGRFLARIPSGLALKNPYFLLNQDVHETEKKTWNFCLRL